MMTSSLRVQTSHSPLSQSAHGLGSPVGSPIRAARELRLQRPATAPSRSGPQKTVRKKKTKIPLGSPKWWARVREKGEMERQRKHAFQEDILANEQLKVEQVDDVRNMIAVWWLERARLSLELWKKRGYDYYGYGSYKPGEIGAGLWHDRVTHGNMYSNLPEDEHVLPRVPPLSEADRTRSIEEDQSDVREARRQWYKQQQEAGVTNWDGWHVNAVAWTPTSSSAELIDSPYLNHYQSEYAMDSQHLPHNGYKSADQSTQSYYLPTSDDDTFSLYSLEDFEPPSARYLTITPRYDNTRRGARPAVAIADFEAADESELTFKAGNVIMVTSQDPSGWWRGYVYDAVERYLGWLPCTYLCWLPPSRALLYTPAKSLDLSSYDGASTDRGSVTSYESSIAPRHVKQNSMHSYGSGDGVGDDDDDDNYDDYDSRGGSVRASVSSDMMESGVEEGKSEVENDVDEYDSDATTITSNTATTDEDKIMISSRRSTGFDSALLSRLPLVIEDDEDADDDNDDDDREVDGFEINAEIDMKAFYSSEGNNRVTPDWYGNDFADTRDVAVNPLAAVVTTSDDDNFGVGVFESGSIPESFVVHNSAHNSVVRDDVGYEYYEPAATLLPSNENAVSNHVTLPSSYDHSDTQTAVDGLWKWNYLTGMWERRDEAGQVIVNADPFAEPDTSQQGPTLARTIHPYRPVDVQELAMEVGDTITILEEDESGWWRGRNHRTGVEGWLPSGFVRKHMGTLSSSESEGEHKEQKAEVEVVDESVAVSSRNGITSAVDNSINSSNPYSYPYHSEHRPTPVLSSANVVSSGGFNGFNVTSTARHQLIRNPAITLAPIQHKRLHSIRTLDW